MLALDLLGDPIPPDPQRGGRRRATKPKGYFAPPGTGPVGKTCKDCAHLRRFLRFSKCDRAKALWTHGRGSDVLQASPACSGFAEGSFIDGV